MLKNHRPVNRGWRLDYFLMSENHESKHGIELIDSIIVDTQMGSDHCPIGLTLRIVADDEA